MLVTVLRVLGLMAGAPPLASQQPLFAPAAGVPVGPGSGTIILADVSGDGRLDMLTRHLLSRMVAVQVGDGHGGFGAAGTHAMRFAYAPGDMKLGDLNNDGILDLAVTAGDRDVVDIFLGNGRGEFSPTPGSPFTVTTAVERYNKRTLQLVDLNEDRNLDVVTANGRRLNTFSALLGNGRGGFSPGPTVRLDSGRDSYWFALGDLDADGHLDVVTASSETGSPDGPAHLVAQFGDGAGTFKPASWSPLPLPPGPGALTIGDVNADQRLDIVIPHRSGLLSVLLNARNGDFAPAAPFNLGTQGFAPTVVDVNRDQIPDLVVATVESVTVLLGDGRGFAPAPGSPFIAGPGAYYLAVGDVNGDGKLDIAASSFEGDRVSVLLGR
jgi:hypothetical protein